MLNMEWGENKELLMGILLLYLRSFMCAIPFMLRIKLHPHMHTCTRTQLKAGTFVNIKRQKMNPQEINTESGTHTHTCAQMKAGNFVNIKWQEMIPQEINTESGLLSKLSDKEI